MRVLSYNIHKGIGGRDRLYRLERVIRAIQHEQPDIVCLQEVDRNVPRSRHDDQPRLLAEFLETQHHLYQLNVRLKEGGYGNLILSRFPIAQTHQVSLTWRNHYRVKKPRGAQLAFIATPNSDEEIEICQMPPGAEPVKVQPDLMHLAFEVEDLTAFAAGLKERGYELSDGPTQSGSGMIAFIDAPEGYEVELIQRSK